MHKYVLTAFLAFFAILLIQRPDVRAFGGCEVDCQKCHTLDKSEVQQILSKMKATDVNVTEIRMSQLKGLWEVTVEDKGRKGIMYIGFSKKHVVAGAIFEVDSTLNVTQERINDINKPADRFVDIAKIPLEGALVMGDPKALHKVIVFTDPDCPFCGQLHAELKKVVAERDDIAFYLKLMPLKFHPDAYWKSQTIICNKSLKLLEENFDKKTIPKPECETRIVSDTMQLAADLGITGTPTMVLPDGRVVSGVKDAAGLITMIMNSKHKGV